MLENVRSEMEFQYCFNLEYQRILPSRLWEVKGTLGSTAGQLCGEGRPELRSSSDGAESEV